MAADDAAGRRCRPGALAAALRRLADTVPADSQIAARADRLAAPPPPLSGLRAAAVCAAAVTLVCLPPAVLLAS